MVERAKARVADTGSVTFEVADLYRWRSPDFYDVVFFSFLLSHVPLARSGRFWEVASSSLTAGGIVTFVDAAPQRRDEEEWLGDGVVRRTLRDGSEHRIVKVFPTPDEVRDSMAQHRLQAQVDVLDDVLLVGIGRRPT